MKAKLLFILCVLFIGTQTAQAQTWNIGYPNAEDVTAVLSGVGNNRTLTISGTGNMRNFSSITPWDSQRANIRTITIEQGITSIGNWAFTSSKSTSVTLSPPF